MRTGRHLLALTAACGLAAGCGPGSPASGPPAGSVDRLQVPDGFAVAIWAEGIPFVRMMAWSPDGTLVVSQPPEGRVLALRDADADGRADRSDVWAEGLTDPHGLAFRDGWLYVAETDRVVRFPWAPDGSTAGPEAVVPDLPARGQHWTRSILFDAEGRLLVSVGSSCNVCEEEDPRRAAVLRFPAEGGDGSIHASGLRNAVGMALHPRTGRVWVADNGRDWLGDDLPPEEIDVLHEGGFYGWPYAYGDRVPDPQMGGVAPERVAASVPPVLTLTAHTAPLGLTFYDGGSFPDSYAGDLFVAQHGSWNRSRPAGFQVLHVDMTGAEGSDPGEVRRFLTGMLGPEGAWGRPVDVAVGPDGALYVTDDRNGWILRIHYPGVTPP